MSTTDGTSAPAEGEARAVDAEDRLPLPNYGAAAPSDWMGARAIGIMLEDVAFPQTAGDLRGRVGNWRVPVRASNESVPLGRLLDGFPEGRRFRSAEDVAHQVAKRFKGF